MKKFITLFTDLDRLEDIENPELDPPGRNAIAKIASLLEGSGYKVSEPKMHDSYGWCINVSGTDGVFWSMIQSSDEFLIISEEVRSLWQRLLGKSSGEFEKYIETLNRLVKNCSDFKDVKTVSRKEFESHGQNK